MDNFVELLTVGGAAGALFYVLKLIVDGKLHTSSEVDGLKKDKVDLLTVNQKLNEALDASNRQLAVALELVAEHKSAQPKPR